MPVDPLEPCICGHGYDDHTKASYLATGIISRGACNKCTNCLKFSFSKPPVLKAPEGKKFDEDKLRLDLLSTTVLEDIGRVLTFGAKKYGDRNWESGISYSRCFGACLRHLFSWWSGEVRDKETNLNHLAHALCCLMFLLHYEQFPDRYKEFNDRPKYY